MQMPTWITNDNAQALSYSVVVAPYSVRCGPAVGVSGVAVKNRFLWPYFGISGHCAEPRTASFPNPFPKHCTKMIGYRNKLPVNDVIADCYRGNHNERRQGHNARMPHRLAPSPCEQAQR